MKGRQVIKVRLPWEMDTLFDFLKSRWDTEKYPEPKLIRPTAITPKDYILLPATFRYCVLIYPAKEKVVLITYPTEEGWKEQFACSMHSKSIIFGAWQISKDLDREKERKGPAEEVLLKYTEYVRTLLENE